MTDAQLLARYEKAQVAFYDALALAWSEYAAARADDPEAQTAAKAQQASWTAAADSKRI